MMETTIELPQDELETSPALQRLWSRRMTITAPLPDETDLGALEDLFPPAQVGTQNYCVRTLSHTVSLGPSGEFFCQTLETRRSVFLADVPCSQKFTVVSEVLTASINRAHPIRLVAVRTLNLTF
jgi:hypothetical protein